MPAPRVPQLVPAAAAGRRPIAVNAILLVNVAVFGLWRWSLATGADLSGFMQEQFMVSLGHLQAGEVFTLLGAAFSHVDGMHLAVNMLVLKSFGDPLERAWGTGRFVTFYLCASVASSAAHVIFSWAGWPDVPAVGASGAIAGILICFTFLYPRRLLLFFFVIPLPAWIAALLFVGLDLWGLIEQRGGHGLPIGHGAHLGGAAFGALWSIIDRSLGNDLEAREQEFIAMQERHLAGQAEAVAQQLRRQIAEALAEAQRHEARADEARRSEAAVERPGAGERRASGEREEARRRRAERSRPQP